ncbi:MAG: helix-turn-helix domain-containing protein [Vulcanimicrobiaceae bacterium]|jgi:putative transcriptional regulator
MQSETDDKNPHVDWSRLGKKSRNQINAEAAEEKAKLGFSGKLERLVAHVDGKSYDVSIPDVRAIRERLGLTQEAFAARFLLSRRTVQQWEQRRATPDMPARILLRAIEQNPEAIAAAAASVERELKEASR